MNHILYQIVDDLAIITLNRPEVANGFHIPMCEEILEALTLAEQDSAVQYILINANGKVFSVGGDLVEMKRAVDEDDIPSLTKIAELVNTISYKIKLGHSVDEQKRISVREYFLDFNDVDHFKPCE